MKGEFLCKSWKMDSNIACSSAEKLQISCQVTVDRKNFSLLQNLAQFIKLNVQDEGILIKYCSFKVQI